jgi:hypothetical protein
LDGEGEVVEKDACAILDAECLDRNHGRGGGCIPSAAGQWRNRKESGGC